MCHKVLGTLTIAALVASACTSPKRNRRAGTRAACPPASSNQLLCSRSPIRACPSPAQAAFRAAQSPLPGGVPDREPAQVPAGRKLVRRGEMTIEVRSVAEALAALDRIIGSMGGHAANQSERHNEYGGRRASVTCRVPAERLDRDIWLKRLACSDPDAQRRRHRRRVRIKTHARASTSRSMRSTAGGPQPSGGTGSRCRRSAARSTSSSSGTVSSCPLNCGTLAANWRERRVTGRVSYHLRSALCRGPSVSVSSLPP